MTELWNKKILEPPPTNTSRVKLDIKDVHNLHKLLIEFQETCNWNSLGEEAALLSRIIYRMKHKFRNDKSFHCMEKINRALLQYLNMNYKQNLETFVNMIDVNSEQSYEIYLPTKQMLEYLLIRSQGFAKLMCRISESCQITVEYMNSRISSGQSWPLALLVISLASRIYAISCFLIHKTCYFFDQIVLYLKILKPKGVRWLPENYSFPKSLISWLDVKIIDYNTITAIKALKTAENLPNSTTKSENHVLNELSNNQITNEVCLNRKLNDSIDLGTAISREFFESIENSKLEKGIKLDEHKNVKHNVQVVKKRKHNINNIKDIITLKKFIKRENKYRKLSSIKSLTKHLDSLQWHSIQKFIEKLIKNTPNVEKKKQQVIKKVKKILTNNIQVN